MWCFVVNAALPTHITHISLKVNGDLKINGTTTVIDARSSRTHADLRHYFKPGTGLGTTLFQNIEFIPESKMTIVKVGSFVEVPSRTIDVKVPPKLLQPLPGAKYGNTYIILRNFAVDGVEEDQSPLEGWD